MYIEPQKFYRPQDEVLRQCFSVQTLAKWLHEERGPKWSYAGNRVLYKGGDILDWLEASSVSPRRS